LWWSSLMAHDSQPHKRALIGMAKKNRYFALRSTYGLSQTFLKAPICWLALSTLACISSSSLRSKLVKVPRYLKVAV
jgi:hypothetical protein